MENEIDIILNVFVLLRLKKGVWQLNEITSLKSRSISIFKANKQYYYNSRFKL